MLMLMNHLVFFLYKIDIGINLLGDTKELFKAVISRSFESASLFRLSSTNYLYIINFILFIIIIKVK